ncbi:MAG: SCO family protein [Actinobacteria bacterium]|nr:SCO family protein [Actinomycetota bacterium]
MIMPGGSGLLDLSNPIVLSRFHHALLVQMFCVLALAGILGLLIWWRTRRKARFGLGLSDPMVEPRARQVLRMGFGLFWLLAGILQLQAAMPIGLATGVLKPAVTGSPSWVLSLVSGVTGRWLAHPVPSAAAVAMVEIGLGVWMMACASGRASQILGGLSAFWALAIWAGGTGFGGLLGPGSSWLFGAPGASLYYVIAGLLLMLRIPTWDRAVLANWLRWGMAIILVGLALLQAWPSSAFWQSGRANAIHQMAGEMASAAQPSWMAASVRWFGDLAARQAVVINLLALCILLFVAFALLWGSELLRRIAALIYSLVAITLWFLVQDLGVFGGLSTDLNAMLPSALLLIVTVLVLEEHQAVRSSRHWIHAALSILGCSAVSLGLAIVLVLAVLPGTNPELAFASGITEAGRYGSLAPINLTTTSGKAFSLSDLRGKVVVLIFVDPVCTSDCPLLAQEVKAALKSVGKRRSVVAVAVNLNPAYRGAEAMAAFGRQEGLRAPNWQLLSGSSREIEDVSSSLRVLAQPLNNGGMLAHNDVIYVIDPRGRISIAWDATPSDDARTRGSLVSALSTEILKSGERP